MLREHLASYWSVILLCAGGLALSIAAAIPAGGPRYPIRLELPAPGEQAGQRKPIETLSGSGLIALLTDAVDVDLAGPNIAEPADSLAQGVLTPPMQPPSPEGLLPVRFDLADPAGAADVRSGTGTLDARKGVRLDGVELGTTAIRISPTSALFIARAELRGLFDSSGRKDLAAKIGGEGADFVSFDDIRRLGFAVRYDPVSDRILVST